MAVVTAEVATGAGGGMERWKESTGLLAVCGWGGGFQPCRVRLTSWSCLCVVQQGVEMGISAAVCKHMSHGNVRATEASLMRKQQVTVLPLPSQASSLYSHTPSQGQRYSDGNDEKKAVQPTSVSPGRPPDQDLQYTPKWRLSRKPPLPCSTA
jgi:hypothetical protein